MKQAQAFTPSWYILIQNAHKMSVGTVHMLSASRRLSASCQPLSSQLKRPSKPSFSGYKVLQCQSPTNSVGRDLQAVSCPCIICGQQIAQLFGLCVCRAILKSLDSDGGWASHTNSINTTLSSTWQSLLKQIRQEFSFFTLKQQMLRLNLNQLHMSRHETKRSWRKRPPKLWVQSCRPRCPTECLWRWTQRRPPTWSPRQFQWHFSPSIFRMVKCLPEKKSKSWVSVQSLTSLNVQHNIRTWLIQIEIRNGSSSQLVPLFFLTCLPCVSWLFYALRNFISGLSFLLKLLSFFLCLRQVWQGRGQGMRKGPPSPSPAPQQLFHPKTQC